MTILQLGDGAVRGHRFDAHISFRGIPYAAPPVGDRRWRAPAPVEPWDGVLEGPGRPAPQLAQSFSAATSLDEDCLTLDVTVPDTGRAGRPVVVWLHGGGGTNGSGADVDPHRLAVTGDVVVVTPNFRLGVFACFGHPDLAGNDKDGGTFGLQDQQAVLRWVRREIARFGGDPGNVTLAGESYGALMIAAHLVAPGSARLFHRAVLQSPFTILDSTPANLFIPGLPALPPRWLPDAELAELGAAMGELAELRRAPVADLLASSGQFIRPAFGGATLPESPATAIPAGRFHRVPLLLGSTLDEARFYANLLGPVTAERYPALLAEAFGAAADVVVARYPLDRFPTPGDAWAQVSTDRAWAWPAWEQGRALAAHTDTWFAEFADRDAPAFGPLPAGAGHGSTLAYLFDVPGGPALSAEQRELADRMIRYWAAFAADGDPGWPRLPHVQSLAPDRIGPTDFVAGHQLDFWAGLTRE
jgi:para-nitrobenzyl esterase